MLPFPGHVAGLLKSAAYLPASHCVPKSRVDESPTECNSGWQP